MGPRNRPKYPLSPVDFMNSSCHTHYSVSKRKPGWFNREAVFNRDECPRLQYHPACTKPWCRSIEGSATLSCCLDRNLCLLNLFIFLWGAWQVVACIDRHRWLHQWCLMWRSSSWPDRDPKTELSLWLRVAACLGWDCPPQTNLLWYSPLPYHKQPKQTWWKSDLFSVSALVSRRKKIEGGA